MSASAATDDHRNSIATATTFTSSVSEKIETTGDVDFFKYRATSSEVNFFTTTGNNSIITVYNASGSAVSSSGGTYGGQKLAGYNMNSGETCYVSVRKYGNKLHLKSRQHVERKPLISRRFTLGKSNNARQYQP